MDVPSIMPVMQDAFDPDFGEAWTAAQCLSTLSLPGGQLLIAKSGTDVAGFALSRGVLDEEELLLIGVLKSARRSGVGQKMIARLQSICSDLKRTVIFLEVRDGNSAYSFYSSLGFVPIGRRPNYYKSGQGVQRDSVTMSLAL